MANNKHTVTSRPIARSERLLVETVGDEAVIYDQDSNIAHALRPLAAAVFMYATGENTVAEIAELASLRLATTVTEREVSEAVEELSGLTLLETHELELDGGGMSRRTALKVFGGAAAGTMLVSSVAAPFAAASTISNNGKPYICGTGAGPITGNTGYPAVSWPQPYTDTSGDLVPPYYAGGPASSSTANPNGVYDLGSPCCVNSAVCTYAYTDETGHKFSYTGSCVDTADITSGVCALGQNAQVGGTKIGTGGSAAVVIGVPSSQCQTGHYVCAVSAGTNVWQAVGSVMTGSGSCSSGQTKITLNSTDVVVTSIDVTTNCTQGTYEVVPCDGASYQCAEVVCVPTTATVTGAITGATSVPKDAAINDTNGTGYSSSAVAYTDLLYVDIGYQYKFCTPCTKTGTCS